MNVDLDFDFGGFDGLWLILGLPLVSLLVFVLLSPVSFLIHKQLTKKYTQDVAPDA